MRRFAPHKLWQGGRGASREKKALFIQAVINAGYGIIARSARSERSERMREGIQIIINALRLLYHNRRLWYNCPIRAERTQ